VGTDPLVAARRALPASLDRRVRVKELKAGAVQIRLRVPVLIPALSLGSVTAHARFASQA
jgi:hypothetical protein